MSFQIRSIRSEDQKKHRSILSRMIGFGVTILGPLAAVWMHMHHKRDEEKAEQQRVSTLKRAMTLLTAALLILVLFAVSFRVLLAMKEFSLSYFTGVAGAGIARDEHGLLNFVILGEGDNDHDGIGLTDTIMVASIDPDDTESAVLLSLPRDLYALQTDKMGKGRINSLYRNYRGALMAGGMKEGEASHASLEQLGTEIGNFLGITIQGVIKVNFQGFTEAVDAIGGVDLDVPEDIVDTQYPGPNYSYETFSLKKGPQHLDGATALKYARSRHSTSDFSRSARQQQLIAAIGKKVQDTGLVRKVSQLTQLFSILSKNIEMTISSRQLITLAGLGKSLNNSRIVNVQLNDQNGLYASLIEPGGFLYSPPREEFEGAFVLLPVSIPEFPVTWKQIRAFSSLIFLNRSLFFAPAPTVVVLNSGAKEGTARKLGGELFRYHFSVQDTRNYPRSAVRPDHSFIAVRSPDPEASSSAPSPGGRDIAEFLSTLLKLPLEELPADAEVQDDIAIVVTKDFTYTPLQDLLPAPR